MAHTSVLRHARPHGVSAITADEPPVFVCDHRFIVNARGAVWAANGQGRVSQHYDPPTTE